MDLEFFRFPPPTSHLMRSMVPSHRQEKRSSDFVNSWPTGKTTGREVVISYERSRLLLAMRNDTDCTKLIWLLQQPCLWLFLPNLVHSRTGRNLSLKIQNFRPISKSSSIPIGLKIMIISGAFVCSPTRGWI
jgi:hypothetical protein